MIIINLNEWALKMKFEEIKFKIQEKVWEKY